MTIDGLRLSDDDFWAAPDKNRTELLRDLRRQKFDGIVLDAPKRVDLGARASLPVILLRAGSYREVWSLGLDEGVLVAIDVDQNQVFAVPLANDEALPEPTPDLSKAPEGYTGSWMPGDLRELLGLEWHAAKVLVTAILRDRVSNRVLVTMGESPATRDPAVDEYVARAWSQVRPTQVDPLPDVDVPSYSPRPESPPVPEAPGIALAIERVSEARTDLRSVLCGAFRVPVAKNETEVSEQLLVGKERRAPTAVVAITLLVTGSREPGPATRRLLVPSFEPVVKTDEGLLAIGHFAVDLRALGLVEPVAQTCYVYAFSRSVMGGPALHALVDPALLPPT